MKLNKRMRFKTIAINNFNAKLWNKFTEQCKKEGMMIKPKLENVIEAYLKNV